MIYPFDFEAKIGFDRIRSLLSDRCLSPMGREKVSQIRFLASLDQLKPVLDAAFEFQSLLRYEEGFPSDHYYEMADCLNSIRVEGTFPEIREIFDLKRSLETVRSIVAFFRARKENKYVVLSELCSSVKIYPFVIESIDRIIDRFGEIKDNASPRLKAIRSESAAKKIQASRRLASILKEAQADGLVDTDTMASVRNGRGVIPVNAYSKRKIRGLIHDQSASGRTVYIEPEEIVELNNDIVELEYEEKREILRILTAFADSIRPYIDDLLISDSFLGEIDFIRAKALLGNHFNSIVPVLAEKPFLSWKQAVHPLLALAFEKTPGRKLVPLTIWLDEKNRILLISGPNAGGKSVCLKTVGLLQYMLQCGFTIPVGEGSESGIFNDILIDIGDEQSIENDLSTYSSHLINMKFFLKNGNSQSLILMDEFGSGTEPMIGGSIAEAVMDSLNRSGVFGVITTHYTNLKYFASVTEGMQNGAMAFDNHLMQPLFELSIGKPGSSFAFEIARKIGLPEEILSRASEKAGTKNINYDRHLRDIARDKRYWEAKRSNIRQHEKKLEELVGEYEKQLAGARKMEKEIISKARETAESMLKESNKLIENTIRQIRESQAEREKTREARQDLEEFKDRMIAGKADAETPSEGKFIRLEKKTARVRIIRKPVAENDSEALKPLMPGDAVRMADTQAAGEVIRIEGDMVHVETGSIKFLVHNDKLERISKAELKKSIRSQMLSMKKDPQLESRKLNFKPEIDIRGVRGDEAIRQVRDFIDNAVMVQHRNLRILHGKGNGILRQLVREYLSTIDIVRSFSDEHIELGGSGVTVVEIDL